MTLVTDVGTTPLRGQNNNSIVANIKLSNEHLSDKQKLELRSVLSKYSDVFANSDSDLGLTNLLEHAIDTQGHAPIYGVVLN